MKNAKRIVIAILSLVLALTLTTLVLSACKSDGFTVTVEFDATQGSVTLSEPTSGDKYAKGESVTVTVTPASGYEIGSFSVDGSYAQLTNRQYTFTVESDTKISVTFKKTTQVSPTARYSVTSLYNSQRGTVELTAPADGGAKYLSGESVTVTVTPIGEYDVGSFSVGGHKDAVLTNGKYTFTVTGDTVIYVTFVLPMPASILEGLRGSILLEGQFVETDYIDFQTYTSEMSTLFDAVHKAAWLQEWYNDRLMFNAIYHNVDGKAALLQHNGLGKLASQVSESDFKDFFNPFEWLEPSDFEYEGDGVWSVYDLDKATVAATAITGYTGSIDSLLLYEDDGVITRTVITYARVSHPDYGMDYQHVYNLDISAGDVTAMPDEWFSDYPELPAHQELKQALEKAHAATSYTVHYSSHEEGYDDIYYNMYATPNGIYEDNVGWEGGFIERVDGRVWWFSYDPDTEKFDFENHPLDSVANLYDIFAWFKLTEAWDDLELSYNLLESKGDGVFELRYNDCFVYDGLTGFAGAIAALFGTGSDQPRFFVTARDFRITIRDGELYKVEFTYDYEGYIAELVVLEFSDFDNTTFPIEITDEAYYGLFAEEYIGSWMDDAANVTVVVTRDRLTVNGQEIEDVVKLDNGYEFTWNGGKCTLTYRSDEEAIVFRDSNGSEKILRSTNCAWAQYIGIYEGVDDKHVAYTVIVSEEGIVVLYGGKTVVSQAVGLGNRAGINYLIFVSHGVDYNFEEDEEGKMHLYSRQEKGIDVHLDRIASGDCAWYNYIGLFRLTTMGISYEIAITSDTIYVTAGEVQTQATNIRFGNSGFTFMLGEESYCISNSNMYRNEVKAIAFYLESDMGNYLELNRESGHGTVSFDRIVHGIWEDKDGKWRIVITDNSLTINGEQVYSVDYVGFAIYAVYYNGLDYMLTTRDGKLYFTRGIDDIFVELTKTGSVFDPSTSNWSKFIGRYESADKSYVIVITANDVQITVNGKAATVVIDGYTDSEGFELIVDGVEYYLMDFESYSNPVQDIFVMTSDYSVTFHVYRVGN